MRSSSRRSLFPPPAPPGTLSDGTVISPPDPASEESVPPEGLPQFSACPDAALPAEADSFTCRQAPPGPLTKGDPAMQGTQQRFDFNSASPIVAPAKPSREIPLVSIASGEKAKARDILAAIRTLKTVEQEKRPATPQEKQTLARFCGFGPVALSIFPDPVTGRYKDGWQEIGEELKSLLTPEEYDSAKRTTFNAFYTSPTVISSMHEAISRLGVSPGATILEPGCGNARFIRPDYRFIGVELDSISGRIARLLHPQADIRIENFRDTRLPQLDAVIGNVPFADVKLDHHGQKFSLHDYFFAKSVDSLKPGGVLALVTSHFTLDKQNAAIREYLASKADFVGAIRLPSDAFKREGTAVVTDIVFFRKREPGQEPNHADPDWLKVAPLEIDGTEVVVNKYFLDHPEQVLGNWTAKDTLYGEGYSVTSNGDLAEQLREAVGRLPEHSFPSRYPLVQRNPRSRRLHAPANRAAHRRRQLLRRR